MRSTQRRRRRITQVPVQDSPGTLPIFEAFMRPGAWGIPRPTCISTAEVGGREHAESTVICFITTAMLYYFLPPGLPPTQKSPGHRESPQGSLGDAPIALYPHRPGDRSPRGIS